MTRFMRLLGRLVLGFLCLSVTSFAQSTNATVMGRVLDPSKAAVGGASVEVTNIDRGTAYKTSTNNAGLFSIPNLSPGSYRISVAKPGFRSIVKPDVTLHVQDVVALNFDLAVGSISEVVTVTGGAPIVNTMSGTVSTVIDQSYIKNMPLNGRSFQDLILLTPGVVTQSPQTGSSLGYSGEFSVNGQRTEENYYTVDGVSANIGTGPSPTSANAVSAGVSGSLPGSTALGTTQGLVSVDSLQEFRVQSSSYSAEYGHNPGGQFAFETKSGTNSWHGSAFEYLRNGFVDAKDWFNDYYGLPEPGIHQNDFGGTAGGPVRIPGIYNGKDKTFFFVSYEGLRLVTPQPASISYVPDESVRQSAAPALLPALRAFPAPNGPSLGGGVGEFIGSWSNPSSINSPSVRLDQAVGSKTNLFFRFNDTSSYTKVYPGGGGTPPSDLTTTRFTLRTYTFGMSSTITNRIANEFRFNRSSNEAEQVQTPANFAGATPLNLVQAAGQPAGISAALAIYLGSYNMILYDQAGISSQAQWNFIDSLSLALGHHAIKIGADYRRLTPGVNLLGSKIFGWGYLDEASIQTNSAYLSAYNYRPYYPLYDNFALFAEDDWRVSERLNLSYGLRWEVNPAPGVTHGIKPWTMIDANDPNHATLASYGTPLWRTTWFNFAPRFGVAYTLRSQTGRETVLRGGVGVFFDSGQQLGTELFGPGSAQFNYTLDPSGAYPQALPFLPIVQPTPPYLNAGGYPPNAWNPHLQLPYTLQWNVSVQQELGKEQALTLSYVGAHASRLIESNLIAPPNNPVVNANGWYDYTYIENGNTSDYNSFQGQFQRKLSAGLTVLASYTFSHCIDYGSSNLFYGYQRGNCSFDVRNNFSAAASYDLPSIGSNVFAKHVFSHWGLDDRFLVRTGFPVNINGFDELYPNGKFYNAGVDLVPGQPIYLYGENCAAVFQQLGGLAAGQTCPGGRAINPNAFTPVHMGLGNAPRDFVRGFGAWQMNAALRREFPINDKVRLQFRAESFNVFNHPNFGSINSGCCGPTFGLATATLANSLGTLNPLYQMGGPRSMQFSLRVGF